MRDGLEFVDEDGTWFPGKEILQAQDKKPGIAKGRIGEIEIGRDVANLPAGLFYFFLQEMKK